MSLTHLVARLGLIGRSQGRARWRWSDLNNQSDSSRRLDLAKACVYVINYKDWSATGHDRKSMPAVKVELWTTCISREAPLLPILVE